MKGIMEMRNPVFKIVLIAAVLFGICVNLDCTSSTIFNPESIMASSIDILGIVLAISAIFFTVVDRYKEKSVRKLDIEHQCFPILREMCDNVMGVLVIVIIMFVVILVEPTLSKILLPRFFGKFNIIRYLFYLGFSLILFILLDITKSIMSLVQGLFLTPREDEQEEQYDIFIRECKKLDNKHFRELVEYTKTLILKQEIEKEK